MEKDWYWTCWKSCNNSITILILVACLWYLFSTVQECDEQSSSYSQCISNKGSSFFENLSKEYSQNYHEKFENALIKAKGGLIIAFILE